MVLLWLIDGVKLDNVGYLEGGLILNVAIRFHDILQGFSVCSQNICPG